MEATIHKVLPENARDYAVCHIACWQAAYRGIIPDDFLDNMSAELDVRAERVEKSIREQTNLKA